VREAQFRGWWHDGQIRDALTRRASARLAAYLGDETPTQSELEDRFLRLCARHRIPRPLTQQGRRPRLDFVWPRERVVVEVDGWEAHRTRAAFQRDRTTTNALQLDGFLVLRFTWEDVNRRPATVAGQVRRALGLDQPGR
jgi:very-short-patch-repair endonuclease